MSKLGSAALRLTTTGILLAGAYFFLLDEAAQKAVVQATTTTLKAIGTTAEKVANLIEERTLDSDTGVEARAQAEAAWKNAGF